MSMFGNAIGIGAAQAGFNMLGTLVNNGISAGMGDYNRSQNFLYNEKAASAADARARALYNDLYSPKALLQQYKDAGLSPSLMFGGGGPGGTTVQGAQGEGASGVGTQTFGINPVDLAQINKLNAETQFIKEQTKTESGENERGKADIEKLFADAGAAKAATAANESQAQLNKGKTLLAYNEANKAFYEALEAGLTYEFNQETFDTRKQIEANKCALLLADKLYKEAQVQLTEQQIKESEQRIVKMYEEIQIGWANALANGTSAEAWSYYLNKKGDYIEQEFGLEMERLGVQKKQMWLNWSSDMFKTTITGLESAMLLKGQGMQTPPIKGVNTNTSHFGRKGEITGSTMTSTTYVR